MMKRTQPRETMPPTPIWSQPIRIVVMVLMLLAGLALLWLARSVWWLLILAGILAYLLQPLVDGLVKLKAPRGLAAMIIILLAATLLILIPILLIPALASDIQPISINLPEIIDKTTVWVLRLPQTLPGFQVFGYRVDLVPIYEQISSQLRGLDISQWWPTPDNWLNIISQAVSSASSVVGIAANLATGVISAAVGIVLGILLLFLMTLYLTKDLPLLAKAVMNLAPTSYQPEWRELWRRTGGVWQAFFRGQIVLSLVVGFATWVGLSILGIPGALALGIIAGLFEVLPNIGPWLALIPAVFLTLLEGSDIYTNVSPLVMVLAVVALYALIQQLENYILVPRILGGSVGLHPALVVVGVFTGAVTFGILGAFIATPLLATVLIWARYAHGKVLGREPFPEMIATPPDPEPPPAPPPLVAPPTAPPPTVVLSPPNDPKDASIVPTRRRADDVSISSDSAEYKNAPYFQSATQDVYNVR